MLRVLLQLGVSCYPHRTVVMQFFETASRYGDFFKIKKGCIMPTLKVFVDSRWGGTVSLIIIPVTYLFFLQRPAQP